MSALMSWSAIERVAVQRTSTGLGSLILARPALATLRRLFPEAQISVSGPAPAHWIVKDLDVEVVDSSTPPRFAPDLTVDLDAAGPPRRSREHIAERQVRILGAQCGAAPDPSALDLRAIIGPARKHGAIVVHATSRMPSRRWWGHAQICRGLQERGYRVVLVGSACERQALLRVAREGAVAEQDCLAGRTDLPGLMRLVAGAPLVISGDTAVGHLATALSTPSVRVMLRTAAADRGPKTGPHSVLRDRSIDAIDPQAVMEAALTRLDRASYERAG